LIAQQGVTVWNSVPALMKLLVEYVTDRSKLLPSSLRLVLMSGDWIPVSLPSQINALAEGAQVISLGGATEASIWSILYQIEAVDPAWTSIPYGRPMTNQSFHVLDEALEPCPVGVTGQLYIGGIGLAKGYWRDEDKTRASFIVHPRTGERLYRTGDLGRYLPDGNIEFLGREDSQVKIQGYRVEPGEVEASLDQHPGVRAAVVTAVGEPREEKRLVAYVVPNEEAVPGTSELRSFLLQKLPEHMVPSAYVILDELPLTPNGKVDRRALPDPPDTGFVPSDHPEVENTSLIARIAQIPAEVLGVGDIDPRTNLLEGGATSVDMVRIVNRLDNELGFRPKLEEFYQSPNAMWLATAYERHRQSLVPTDELDRVAQASVPAPESVLTSFELLLDPEEREAFKKKQLGLRRGDDEKPQIQLIAAEAGEDSRGKYTLRRSYRRFAIEPIPFAQFGEFLGCLRQIRIDGKPKYLYASAGGLYPVQTYLYVKPGRVEALPAGIYYYHAVEHRLVLLSADVVLDRGLYDLLINAPVFDEAAFSVFLIAQLGAIAPLYGERSVHFATIEAGLMAQLLETSAPSYGIGLCQIGHLDFQRIRHHFALDESHAFVHSLLGGSTDAHRENGWSPFQEAYRPAAPTVDEREEGEI
jgi:pyochelin synthetase